MKKIIFIVVLIFSLTSFSIANRLNTANYVNDYDTTKFYIGINPIAFFTRINTPMTKLIIPVFSNMEYDIALNGGYFINNFSSVETRISVGKPNLNYLTFQLNFGYNVFITKLLSKSKDNAKRSFYVGIYARYINNNNLLTEIKFNNIIPNFAIGYRWNKQHFFYDIRLNQIFAAYSWSNLENTKPNYGWYFTGTSLTPIFPTISFNLGINL